MTQQVAINTLPFWSRIVLECDLRYDGTNLMRRILAAGSTIEAFDYRKGENDVNALQGQGSTARDTLLTKSAETRGGGQFKIMGLSFTRDGDAYETATRAAGFAEAQRNGTSFTLYPPTTHQPGNGDFGPVTPSPEDIRGLGTIFNDLFSQFQRITINVDGTKRILEFGPGSIHSGINGQAGGNVYSGNGSPFQNNYFYFAEGIDWNPAGTVDSNLTIGIGSAYDLYLPTYTTPTGTADGLPVTPENPAIDSAEPTPIGRLWRQAWIVNLHGVEISPTSEVS